jgi:hypothetical protein
MVKNYFIILTTNFANQLSLYSVILLKHYLLLEQNRYNLVLIYKMFSSAVWSDVMEETSFKTFK